MEKYMTTEEIKQLAQKYHTPGEHIKKTWHPEYIKECEKINRKEIEKQITKKYERVKRFV
jgi:hypothetical protein